MKIEIEEKGSGYRYNHKGFKVGSKWLDMDDNEIVTVAGQGHAGMPEMERADGSTYLANPLILTISQ